MSRDFQFYAPVHVFEKADAPEGQERRIAGLVTTESRDQQGETILQRGLSFDEFKESGWFNNNHDKDPRGVLGYPDDVRFVRKGESLPDGRRSPADGHWAEGYLLKGYKPADEIWELARSLEKTPHRRLGFSIEGKIERRSGVDGKTISKARVRNVALTHCPVNSDTGLMTLAKALSEEFAEMADEETATKASPSSFTDPATSDTASNDPSVLSAALTSTSGAALIPQSLEHGEHDEKRAPSHMNKSEAAEFIAARYNISPPTANRLAEVCWALRDRGLL